MVSMPSPNSTLLVGGEAIGAGPAKDERTTGSQTISLSRASFQKSVHLFERQNNSMRDSLSVELVPPISLGIKSLDADRHLPVDFPKRKQRLSEQAQFTQANFDRCRCLLRGRGARSESRPSKKD